MTTQGHLRFILYQTSHSSSLSIKWYKALAENEKPRNGLYRIGLDGAGKNKAKEFITYASNNGIVLAYTSPHAQESSGVAENIIQDVPETTRSLFYASKLPVQLWNEAVSHANWIQNRPSKHRIGMKVPYKE